MKLYMKILCLLILALMLTDLVVDMFFASQVASQGPKLIETLSTGELLKAGALALAIIACMVACVGTFVRFVMNINRGEVFTSKNVSLIRWFGVCAMLCGVGVIILLHSFTETAVADAFAKGVDALGEGLFALLMGEVFSIGKDLKTR